MKVALVYDRVNKWGGAERLLLALHELFPKAPLYTSVYNIQTASWAQVFKIKSSFLQKFPKATLAHEYYPLFMPSAFESFSFDAYDLVISVTSEAAKGIITKPHTKHICYCLTPTRYLWSGYEDYFKDNFFKTISYPATYYLRKWDHAAAQRPDAFIAISKEVQSRIKQYYGRESALVYPPVEISNFKFKISNKSEYKKKKISKNSYFLVVSRLVSYKRIDIAIEAFNKLKENLIVIGTGSEEKKLREIAGSTITFIGNISDVELQEYYKNCKALIFPGNEDFGLTVLEAQAFGKPVIAYKKGGALETIIEGKTGDFFYPQTANSLIKVVQKFRKIKYNTDECKNQAQKFNKDRFKEEFVKTLDLLLQ